MNKTTFDTRIDELLNRFIPCMCQFEQGFAWKKGTTCTCEQSEAKAQLRTLVNDVCMEVIGEDVIGLLPTTPYEVQTNRLKAEQRTKLATILEGSE